MTSLGSSIAQDSMSRKAAVGLGIAEQGGSYVIQGRVRSFRVSGGKAWIRTTRGSSQAATMSSVATADVDVAGSVLVKRLPTRSKAALTVGLDARSSAASRYVANLTVGKGGRTGLEIIRVNPDQSSTPVVRKPLSFRVKAGKWYRLRLVVTGASPVQLAAKAWRSTKPEPVVWTISATDQPVGSQVAGTVGFQTSASAGARTSQVAVDDFSARTLPPGTVATSVPVLPTDGSGSQANSTGSGTSPGLPGGANIPAVLPVVGRGAVLPVSYELGSLGGRVWFVSPSGSDSAVGSLVAPLRSLKKAVSLAGAGDSVVLRGGVYPVSESVGTTVSVAGLTVVAYPGEVPVFDGSVVPGAVSVEGSLRYVSYRPMPAVLGEGLSWLNLPKATFSGSSPTGLAADRGWVCVAGSSYSVPVPSVADPDGCSGSDSPRVITGYYPDQVWVDGRALVQVHDKSRVRAGTFFVARSSATDAAPGVGSLYLSAADAADMSKVRVSGSSGNFLVIKADGVRVEGIRVVNHSPAMNSYAIVATSGVDDLELSNIELDSNASIALKLAGGSTAGGSGLIRRAVVDHVTSTRSGWSDAVINYTDDTVLTNSRFTTANPDGEYDGAPQLGGIKATKNDRMRVVNCLFEANDGPGLWFDQSNYDVVVANSGFANNSETALFYEISHALTLVNNRILQPSGTGPAVRLAGASQVKLVNNTIIGGKDTISVLADARSKSYGSDNRACSEHTVRYGQGGTLSDCNIGYSSDLDLARPGAYGATNLTPGMDWMPTITLMVNNILANPTGSGNCGTTVVLCINSYVAWGTVNNKVAPNTIVHSASVLDGNVYQTTAKTAKVLTTTGQTGGFTATTLTDMTGTNGFGSTVYNKTTETNGKYATTGLVNPDGTTTTLDHTQAPPTPTDPTINTYIPTGTRHYGALDD